MLLPIYLLTITIMWPDEWQFVTLNWLTWMAQWWQNATPQTRGQELETAFTAAANTMNAARNEIWPRIGDYVEAYRPQQYQPYWRSIYEELWFVSRDEFKELENTIDRLRDENVGLRQQVSNLQSMILNLDWLIGEVRQILRFRYVD